MDFFETVHKRRSVREFTTKVVPTEVIEKAIDAALVAPNSSNLQPWEFYWVKSPEKKSRLVQFCFSQSAARTASDLIVAVSRVDTWKKHRALILKDMESRGPLPGFALTYYNKIVPVSYVQDPIGVLGLFKKIIFTGLGFFRPVPRSPFTRQQLFETVTKTTALACENLMLAVKAQGFDSCPMEGFDENRVKKLLGLNSHCHVVMVIGIGEADPAGAMLPQFRVPRELVFKTV